MALFTVERCAVPTKSEQRRLHVHSFPSPEPVGPCAVEVGVRVTLEDGAAWIGVFEHSGYDSPPAIDFELLDWPDDKSFCLVAGGQGYVVRADIPALERSVRCFPITDVRAVPELGLVLFLDFTGVVAYDSTRVAWESPRLTYDGLEVVDLRGSQLVLRGWNAPMRRTDGMTLDLRTGLSPDTFYEADRPWLGSVNLRRRPEPAK